MQHVENPEMWHGRLLDPLPGRRDRVSATVERQEAEDFAKFAGLGQ